MLELSDDDYLYRRLSPHHLRADGTVNSSAFKTGKGFDAAISVDLASMINSPEDALKIRPGFGLGALRIGDVRALGPTVHRDPLPENPAHCLIEGMGSKDQARSLADKTRVLIQPLADPS